MFYLLPACESWCKPEEVLIENAPKADKKWTPCEQVGLVLDITLIACAIIVASLTLCVHMGIPMGPLNALSNAALPIMYSLGGFAGTMLLFDVVKLMYCPPAPPVPRAVQNNKPQETPKPKAQSERLNRTKKTGGKPPLQEPEKLFAQQKTTVPLLHLLAAPSNPLEESGIFNINEAEQVEIREEADFKQTEEAQSLISTWGNYYIDTDGWSGYFVSQAGHVLITGFNTVVEVAKTTSKAAVDYTKTYAYPGDIKMHFYFLQMNFIVDLFCAYDVETRSFKKQSLPLSFNKKLWQLSKKEINDPDLNVYRNLLLKIIQDNRGHNHTSRYGLLSQIETTFETLKDLSEGVRVFLRKLSYQLYTGFDAFSYGQNVVKQILDKKNLSFSSIHETIKSDHKKIKQLKEDQSPLLSAAGRGFVDTFKNLTGVKYYPMLDNDFACPLWQETYQGNHTVKVIRFSESTFIDGLGSADVIAQLQLFVQECFEQKSEQRQTILNFQHQNYGNGSSSRLDAMHRLANRRPETYYFLNLSMDSDMWRQSRQGIDVDDNPNGQILIPYEAFKESLVADIVKPLRSNKPEDLKNMSANLISLIKKLKPGNAFETDVANLADRVSEYFSDALLDEMPCVVRKDFMFLFYARYRQYLNNLILPTFSCHQDDDSDNAMSLAACSFLMNAIDLNLQNDANVLNSFRTLACANSIMVKGAPMSDDKFSRFVRVVEVLNNGPQEEAKEAAPSTLTDFRLFDKAFNHTTTPFPTNAATEKQYLDCELMQSTDDRLIPVMPMPLTDEDLSLEEKAKRLVQNLYRNSSFGFYAEVSEDYTFKVFHGHEVIVKGEIDVRNDKLYLKIEKV